MDDKIRYNVTELKDFETLLLDKLEIAKKELEIYREMLSGNGSRRNNTSMESGAESSQREEVNALAARQKKYISNVENALIRIKNGTYGVCFKSGKLISKARLMAVPTTTQSIEEKMKQY